MNIIIDKNRADDLEMSQRHNIDASGTLTPEPSRDDHDILLSSSSFFQDAASRSKACQSRPITKRVEVWGHILADKLQD